MKMQRPEKAPDLLLIFYSGNCSCLTIDFVLQVLKKRTSNHIPI